MTDYTVIADSQVDPNAPLTSELMTALRDNPIAIAQGAVGAPLVIGATSVLLSRTVISGTPASVDFTFDNTLYDSVVFKLQNVIPQTNNVALYVRTSTDAGVSYDSGVSDYSWAYNTIVMTTAATTTDVADDADAQMVLSGLIGSDTGEDGWSGEMALFGPQLAKKTSVNFKGCYISSNGQEILINGAGYRLSSADVDGVRFLLSSGNFESGTITVYGVRNT